MENSRVLVYLESLEGKVKKLVAEHQSLKNELMASMEENRNLAIHAQNLEDEIQSLNHKRADTGIEKEGLEEDLNYLKFENKGLTDALANIQEHIHEVQSKSEELLQEYDRLKKENDRLTELQNEFENTYKQQVSAKEYPLDQRTEDYLEKESLSFQVEASKKEVKEWKEKFEKQEEAFKNFQNREKNGKIVESIVEDGTNTNELKLRINEYIKEIDKCIAQLSD